jgi:hypothetical protein
MLFVPSGILDDEAGLTLRFGIDQSYRPESPNEDWRGFSGGAVVLAESPDSGVVWIYGVAQQVPASFTRGLEVARLAEACKDQTFCDALKRANTLVEMPADPATVRPLKARMLPPQLSEHMIERRAVVDRLRACLIPDRTASAPRRAALVGMGGLGKTSLAIALASNDAVRANFSNGLLWTQLGTTPDLRQRLSDWGRGMEDLAPNASYADPLAATSRLRELLNGQHVLLVVDDVWRREDLEPFLVGGSGSLLLFTTRNPVVAEAADEIIHVEALTEDESLAVAEQWTGPIAGADRVIAVELAQAVGNLPLAVALVAAQAKVIGWTMVRAQFAKRGIDLLRRSRDASGRLDSIQGCLDLSIDALKEPDRERYVRLSILTEKARFGASTVAALWSVDADEALYLLTDLSARALVQRQTVTTASWFMLHDLLRDTAGARLDKDGARSVHSLLVDVYRARCSGKWEKLLDDGYVHANLALHMEKAGRADDLHWLLSQETQERRNAWFEARQRQGDVEGFIGDVDRAWRLVGISPTDTSSAANAEMMVRLTCRYALTSASMCSRSENILPALFVALVLRGGKSLEWASSVIRMLPNEQRCDLLVALAPHIAPGALSDVIRVAREILNTVERVRALVALVVRIDGEDRSAVMEEIHKVIDETVEVDKKLDLLSSAIPAFPEETVMPMIDRALAAGPERRNTLWRVTTLMALAQKGGSAAAKALAARALAIAHNETDVNMRLSSLSKIAPLLAKEEVRAAILTEVLVAIRSGAVEEAGIPGEDLARIVPAIPESMLEEVYAAVSMTGSLDEFLSSLAPRLPLNLVRDRIARVEASEPRNWRSVRLLAAFLQRLTGMGQLDEALKHARIVQQGSFRADVFRGILAALSGNVSNALADEALASARTIDDGRLRVHAMVGLVEVIPAYLRSRVALEILAEARNVTFARERAQLVDRLVPYLPDAALSDALATAETIADQFDMSAIAHSIALLCRGSEKTTMIGWLEDSLKTVSPPGTPNRNHALKEISTRFADSSKWELAIEAARQIAIAEPGSLEQSHGMRWKADALATLLPRLPDTMRDQISKEALDAALSGERDHWCVECLVNLSTALNSAYAVQALDEAHRIARELTEPEEQAAAVAKVASAVSDPLRGELANQALEISSKLETYFWSQVIPDLVTVIPDNVAKRYLAVPPNNDFSINDVIIGSRLIELTGKSLPADLRETWLCSALEESRDTEELETRAVALARLSRVLSAPMSVQAARESWDAAAKLDHQTRSYVLRNIASQLPESLLDNALAAARILDDDGSILEKLAPRLAQAGRVNEALAIAIQSERSGAFAAIVPSLPDSLIWNAFDEAWSFFESDRDDLLSALVARVAPAGSDLTVAAWHWTFRHLAGLSRSEVAQALPVLAPLAKELAGQSSATQLIEALREVQRWWP